jgi:hypothetical protein
MGNPGQVSGRMEMIKMTTANKDRCLTVKETELVVDAEDSGTVDTTVEAAEALSRYARHRDAACAACTDGVKLMRMVTRGGEKAIERVIKRLRQERRERARTQSCARTEAHL